MKEAWNMMPRHIKMDVIAIILAKATLFISAVGFGMKFMPRFFTAEELAWITIGSVAYLIYSSFLSIFREWRVTNYPRNNERM